MKKDSLIKMHGASLLMYIQNPNRNSKNQRELRVRETLATSHRGDQKMTDRMVWFGGCYAEKGKKHIMTLMRWSPLVSKCHW